MKSLFFRFFLLVSISLFSIACSSERRKKAETLPDKLSEEDKNTTPREHRMLIFKLPPVVGIGDTIVDDDFFDIEGNTIQISDYLGKYLLLNFWSSSCGYCIIPCAVII